jgi:hypothetical protein
VDWSQVRFCSRMMEFEGEDIAAVVVTCVGVDQLFGMTERQGVVGVGLLRVGEGPNLVHPQVDLFRIFVLLWK